MQQGQGRQEEQQLLVQGVVFVLVVCPIRSKWIVASLRELGQQQRQEEVQVLQQPRVEVVALPLAWPTRRTIHRLMLLLLHLELMKRLAELKQELVWRVWTSEDRHHGHRDLFPEHLWMRGNQFSV